MFQRHQDITFGETGQTLVWDAPEGRPSSVTGVTVYQATTGDTGSTESATTGSASVETNPNTTLDASAGFSQTNPRLIPITATTGAAIGRSYLVTAADGFKEWIEVAEIDSGVSVTARNPLAGNYASADTFQSTRISIAIDSTWVADQSNLDRALTARPGYRIRWEYVVSSITYVHDSYFDLVRYAGGHSVLPAHLDAMYPGYTDYLPTHHRTDQGIRLLDEAYQQVRWDLAASDVDDSSIRDVDFLNRAVMLRFGVILAEEGETEKLELRDKRYREFIDRLFRVTTKVDVSADTSGGGHHIPAVPLWTK